jgi:hypothetical protein
MVDSGSITQPREGLKKLFALEVAKVLLPDYVRPQTLESPEISYRVPMLKRASHNKYDLE